METLLTLTKSGAAGLTGKLCRWDERCVFGSLCELTCFALLSFRRKNQHLQAANLSRVIKKRVEERGEKILSAIAAVLLQCL